MKITKQKVQSVADLKAGYTLGHADVAMLKAMARQLLSGLEQKPVATFYKSECGNVFNTLDGWLPVEGVNNLYAAPQLPQQAVAVPLAIHDEDFEKALSVLNDTLDDCGDSERGLLLALDKAGIEVRSDAFRAAMLQGDEHVTDNTNQQFESLSRGDK